MKYLFFFLRKENKKQKQNGGRLAVPAINSSMFVDTLKVFSECSQTGSVPIGLPAGSVPC